MEQWLAPKRNGGSFWSDRQLKTVRIIHERTKLTSKNENFVKVIEQDELIRKIGKNTKIIESEINVYI